MKIVPWFRNFATLDVKSIASSIFAISKKIAQAKCKFLKSLIPLFILESTSPKCFFSESLFALLNSTQCRGSASKVMKK